MNKHQHKIPFLLRVALFFVLPYNDLINLSGDFEELYYNKRSVDGRVMAFLWLIWQILISAPGFVFNKFYWGITMLKNYLLTTLRNIKKQKLNNSLNVFGLAIALASCLIIYTHIGNELSYENSFPKADRIYRFDIDAVYGDATRFWTNSPIPMGQTLKDEFPEVEDFVRIFESMGTVVFKYESPTNGIKSFEEKNGIYADGSIASMFDLNFISGDPSTTLTNSASVVMSESMAHRYFGSENPVGKSVYDIANGYPLLVTGVMKDLPQNTHLKYDFIVSINTWFDLLRKYGFGDGMTSHSWKAVCTYVLLKDNHSISRLRDKMPGFVKQWHAAQPQRQETFLFMPIKDIHLYSHRENDPITNSDISYIYIFSIIGIFILLIAVVNFINISLAQAFKRFKEVGVRKAIGAQKKQIFSQFIGESFALTLFATIFAVIIAALFLPVYNNLSGNNLQLSQLFAGSILPLILLLMLFISLAAGFYPATFISRFPAVSTIANFKNPKSSISLVRKGLVIVQFVISVFMILATLTVYQQLQFLQNRDLGFNKTGLIAVNIFGDFRDREKNLSETFKERLLQYSNITDVTFAAQIPGEPLSIEHLIPQGRDQSELPTVRLLTVDEDYLKTMQINMIAGQDFRNYSGNEKHFILNEAAVKILDIKDPVGFPCSSYRGQGEIAGVIKDFNFESLHNLVEPLVLEYRKGAENYLIMRCTSKNVSDVLKYAETEFKKIAPDHLFNYSFISDDLNKLYSMETNLGEVFQAFAFLSILISCLGLFGLSVYTAELKIKEIGIRKVLGASVSNITSLLSKEFILWVTIANIIAWPTAYYFMNRWLDGFAYRIDLGIGIFIIGGVLSLLIAFFTVSYQSIKAATANPVKSLRTE